MSQVDQCENEINWWVRSRNVSLIQKLYLITLTYSLSDYWNSVIMRQFLNVVSNCPYLVVTVIVHVTFGLHWNWLWGWEYVTEEILLAKSNQKLLIYGMLFIAPNHLCFFFISPYLVETRYPFAKITSKNWEISWGLSVPGNWKNFERK